MLRNSAPTLLLMAIALMAIAAVTPSLAAQTARPGPKREHFQNAKVLYGWAQDSRGERLRTFITRPNNATGKVPAIFFVGWLSCDSMEYPDADTKDGFGILLRRLIEQSGYATLRMDKPGVGDSEGDCGKADFAEELSGYQSAFEEMLKYDFIDPAKIFLIGLSNGGGTSALVPRQHPVRGYIAASSWGRTWYEHMLELERRRLTKDGKSPAEVNAAINAFVEFYTLYLIKGMTPGQVIAQHPKWKSLWYDSPDGQYGRPAAFYQQLQALNLGEIWQKVNEPVLIIHGAADNIMSRADSEALGQIVNRVHPGHARYLEVDDMTHGFTVRDKFCEELIPTILTWMKERAAGN
ncbi:MAG TPA: alpha/beta hydrolase [Terriglobales bacterium]|nr:alpha/beta hydrolase [Terriglobales bacterium]